MTTPEELKRQIEEKMINTTLARLHEAAKIVHQREKFRAYKQQHRQLQQAHRLLVLEHKELKTKYVRICAHATELDAQLYELSMRRSHFPTED